MIGVDSVGARLIELRAARGLTLQQLADQSGLSISFLSQVEHDKVNISVANLKKIALALGIHMTAFFSAKEVPPQGLVTRAAERRRLYLAETGWQIEALLPEDATRLEAFLVRLAPGSSDNTAYPHQGDEFSLVLQGVIRYTVSEESYLLAAGDTIYHKSNVPHQWQNAGDEEALVLTVATPPAF
ncbi:MAG: XRE family transcriptional regulator [Anaerolineae bacterium]